MQPQDYSKLVLGLNRIAGTGLVFTDLLGGRTDFGSMEKRVFEFVGQWLGGFSVPLRTLKDFFAAGSKKEATLRTTRQSPITGPFRGNIPFKSQKLPPLFSPFEKGPIITKHPLLKQFTGIIARPQNDLRDRTIRLGMKYQQVYPFTGDSQTDNVVARFMGETIAEAPLDVGSSFLKNLEQVQEREVIKGYFSAVKKEAMQRLLEEKPGLAFKLKIKRQKKQFNLLGITDEQHQEFINNLFQ